MLLLGLLAADAFGMGRHAPQRGRRVLRRFGGESGIGLGGREPCDGVELLEVQAAIGMDGPDLREVVQHSRHAHHLAGGLGQDAEERRRPGLHRRSTVVAPLHGRVVGGELREQFGLHRTPQRVELVDHVCPVDGLLESLDGHRSVRVVMEHMFVA